VKQNKNSDVNKKNSSVSMIPIHNPKKSHLLYWARQSTQCTWCECVQGSIACREVCD